MYMPNALYKRFTMILTILSWSYGFLLLLSGLDKIMELSNAQWTYFVSSIVEYGIPLRLSYILLGLSSIQMLIGFLLFIPRSARLGAYLGGFLLVVLSANLFATQSSFGGALVNLMLAIGMLLLAQLLMIKDGMRDMTA